MNSDLESRGLSKCGNFFFQWSTKLPKLDVFKRTCPCKNRPLKFSWKMDCLHFFYASQATYAMNENHLYFDRFAFFIFFEEYFCTYPENHTNRKLKPQKLGVTLCLLKLCTFNKITQFFQHYGIILSSLHTIKNYLLILNESKVMTF